MPKRTKEEQIKHRKEYMREYSKKYREQHRAELYAYKLEWEKKHPGCRKEANARYWKKYAARKKAEAAAAQEACPPEQTTTDP